MLIRCCKVLLVVLLSLAICCGCAFTSETPANSHFQGPEKISLEDAKAVVEQALPIRPYKYYTEFQTVDTIEGRQYYYFLVYTLSSEPIMGDQGPFYQQFTYVWAYVDVQTGELYEMQPEGFELVPWNKSY